MLRFRMAWMLLPCLALQGVVSAAQSAPRTMNSDLPSGSWRFIVSGDSRNCGDVVMPAIAAQSQQYKPAFYWHLGDLRAIYKVDEDIAFSNSFQEHPLSCESYHRLAWKDFVANQIGAFGDTPFFVGIGNHETIQPKTEEGFNREFFDWLDQPTLHHQRELDGEPRQPEPYYHWVQGGVDFLYLDNASDCFSDAQMEWFQHRLTAAKSNPAIKSLVVGMHEALPGSFSFDHAMGDKPDEPDSLKTGQLVYQALIEFQKAKPVYLLASHSHFFMENIYSTDQLTANGTKPLLGWIVGTAGAVRYALPTKLPSAPAVSQTDIYGYMLGTVSANGEIQFSYEQVRETDVPQSVWGRYSPAGIRWCFDQNTQTTGKKPDLTLNCPSARTTTCGKK